MATIVDRVRFILELEKERMVKKGLVNNLIGWGTLISIFAFIPPAVKSIWPAHIQNPFLFYVTIATLALSLSTPLYFLIYLPGYMKWIKGYQKYAITPDLPKPWDKPDWPQIRIRWAKIFLFNKYVINPCYLLVIGSVVSVSYQCDLESFPTSLSLAKSVICIMFVDDLFYWIAHRLFHEVKFLYKFHKVHHQFENVFSMLGQYCHPVEQIFANILPATFAFLLIKCHMFVICFWLAYKSFASSEGHSGYEFPWSFARVVPFVYDASYHDFHHTHNVGNYATALHIVETLAGTNDVFFEQEYKKGKIKTRLRKSKIQ